MNYKSISDLNDDTRQFVQEYLHDIDLVVGIPRSGLLAANFLCLHLNVPMTDVDRLCENRLIDTGERYAEDPSFRDFDSVLVVDDSVRTGSQMTETRNRLAKHDFPFDLSYGAVYVSSRGHEHVDHWGEIVSMPRVFEWSNYTDDPRHASMIELFGRENAAHRHPGEDPETTASRTGRPNGDVEQRRRPSENPVTPVGRTGG